MDIYIDPSEPIPCLQRGLAGENPTVHHIPLDRARIAGHLHNGDPRRHHVRHQGIDRLHSAQIPFSAPRFVIRHQAERLPIYRRRIPHVRKLHPSLHRRHRRRPHQFTRRRHRQRYRIGEIHVQHTRIVPPFHHRLNRERTATHHIPVHRIPIRWQRPKHQPRRHRIDHQSLRRRRRQSPVADRQREQFPVRRTGDRQTRKTHLPRTPVPDDAARQHHIPRRRAQVRAARPVVPIPHPQSIPRFQNRLRRKHPTIHHIPIHRAHIGRQHRKRNPIRHHIQSKGRR